LIFIGYASSMEAKGPFSQFDWLSIPQPVKEKNRRMKSN
jgi:hypothetical protein